IPLRGLPELGSLDIKVRVGAEGRVVEEHKQRYVPVADFEAATVHPAGRSGLRSEDLMVMRVAPMVDGEPDEIGSLLVLVDTSASRALGFADEVKTVEKLIGGLRDGAGADVPVAVAAFDQAVELIYEGTAGGFDAAAAKQVLLHLPGRVR